MSIDDRFDELAASLGGFYRTWAVYLGLELGLFARLRDAGSEGLTPAELATAGRCQADPVEVWIRLAHAVDLVEFDGLRARAIDDVNTVLLADERPEFLGGQFVSTVVSSLDYDRMAEFFRTGRSIPSGHRASIGRSRRSPPRTSRSSSRRPWPSCPTWRPGWPRAVGSSTWPAAAGAG